MPFPAALLVPFLAAAFPTVQGTDPDTDRDGLSDFHEIHKHLSDPKKADTDGDGIPDGDWEERREHAYTVRAVMHVMAPFDVASMTDDYQDVRVLDLRADLLEVEVVVYPFNTVASAIEPNARWRTPAPELKRYLEPGVCCNWDPKMQRQLVEELKAAGIDLGALDDAETSRSVAKWLLDRAEYEDSFTTFAIEFPDGKPRVCERLQEDMAQTLKRFKRTLEQQFDRELLGRGMFETRTRGSCTSSAIYLSTGLKAAGIPARTIVCVPVIDANDEREVAWLDSRIEHVGVRATLKRQAEQQRGTWTSHTFNEVFVGDRWRRLNYANLGQNVLDPETLGLMVHVHTFVDHSEAGLAGWGNRESHPQHASLFGGPNPYSCVSLSDRFGVHSKVANEPLAGGLREATISKLAWYGDPKGPGRTTDLGPDDGAGHLFAHLESVAGSGGRAFVEFYGAVDKRFVLRARGHDDIPATAIAKYWYDPEQGVNDFLLRIEPADFARMERGIDYEPAWLGADAPLRFAVRKGVSIARPKD